MRGKPTKKQMMGDSRDGTSPRMRGKQMHQRAREGLLRNIPAYAGKTDVEDDCLARVTEHPRVCGENPKMPDEKIQDAGTSPRMRGKRDFFRSIWNNFRNIPAYAGKTSPCPFSRQSSQEHPRVCGENAPCTAEKNPR
mgnify:CR=1 FL=1